MIRDRGAVRRAIRFPYELPILHVIADGVVVGLVTGLVGAVDAVALALMWHRKVRTAHRNNAGRPSPALYEEHRHHAAVAAGLSVALANHDRLRRSREDSGRPW